MGVIRKLKDKELVGGTQDEEVYPVTSTQSVYNSQNKTLDQLLALNLPINISANYSANHSATAYSLQEAISAVPLYDRRIGFVGTFLSKDLTPNKWVTIQYNGVSVDSSAWVNPDNWVQMLSELDIVQSSGNSEDKVMSQKAVKELVERYNDSKVVYDLSLFDDLSSGDSVSDAFIPISGGVKGETRFPSVGDRVVNIAYGAIQGIVIFSGTEIRTGRKVVIYTSYGGVNTIYINNDRYVSNISRTHVYNFALLKTINGDSMSSELRAAFIPMNGNEVIPPRAGDVAVSDESSESAVFVSVTYGNKTYTIHYIVNDEHRIIRASFDWTIQDYTVYSLPELKYSIEALTTELPLSRFLALHTGDSQVNVAQALGMSSSATSGRITSSLIRLSTVPVINLVSNNADASENRIKCNISEFPEIIGTSSKTLHRISFIYMGKAYDYDFYAKDNNEYTVRVTVGGLNVETLSFNAIQALDGSSNVSTIKTVLKIDSSQPIKSRLEELSKCTVVLTDDNARDNFENRTYVNLYKSRKSIGSTSYAGVAMTYMGPDFIQTTFFYNPTPEGEDLDYSKVLREVFLLGKPSTD